MYKISLNYNLIIISRAKTVVRLLAPLIHVKLFGV